METKLAIRADGYVNILTLCPKAKPLFVAYMENDTVKKFLEELTTLKKKGIYQLIEYRPFEYRSIGIWVHPCVATHFTCCYSPLYFAKLIQWIEQWQGSLPESDSIQLAPFVRENETYLEDSICNII